MAYTSTKWENFPSTNIPLSADNMNKLEQGVKALHVALESGELKSEPGEFDVSKLTEDDITALKLKLGIG